MDLVIVISLEEKETFTPLLRTERSTEVPSCLAQACGHFMEPVGSLLGVWVTDTLAILVVC